MNLIKGTTINVRLTNTFGFTSSAGGTFDHVFNLHNPNTYLDGASAMDYWTNYSTLYDFYRVRAIKIEFWPILPNDPSTTTVFQPIVFQYDEDSSANLASFDAAISNQSRKVYMLNRPFKYYKRLKKVAPGEQVMPGGWQDCATPVAKGAIKAYASGLDASTQYGVVAVTHYVQFRHKL